MSCCLPYPEEQKGSLEVALANCNVSATCIGQMNGNVEKLDLKLGEADYHLEEKSLPAFCLITLYVVTSSDDYVCLTAPMFVVGNISRFKERIIIWIKPPKKAALEKAFALPTLSIFLL